MAGRRCAGKYGAINPKTVGVATFDAIDRHGVIHNASSLPFSADTLTSHAINLNFPGDTTIYSPYYQPQGLGNEPQEQDSLLLEFFDPASEEWVGAWSASAQLSKGKVVEKYKLNNTLKTIESDTLNKSFIRVHFPVKEARFLKNGFRIRFRNIASLAQNQQVPSIRGNCDHWHLDVVYLDIHRSYNDSALIDIAFTSRWAQCLKLREYPLETFHQSGSNSRVAQPFRIPIHYRNLGAKHPKRIRYFTFLNHSTGV